MNNSTKQLSLKLQSATKTKRMREVPASFQILQNAVESQIKEEREKNILDTQVYKSGRDYTIRYVDGDQELINVSDDEDLLTAYEVA